MAENITVWGCGAANYANGNGSPDTIFAPKLATAVQSAGHFISVSAGNLVSMGVSADHKLYTWGEDAHAATLVESVKFPVRAVVQHTEMPYGCLLGVDGSVWSWGKSDDFLTGLATELPVPLKGTGPLRLEGFDSRVVKVSLGSKHGAALTEKGTVYVWGTGIGVGLDPTSPMPYHATPGKVAIPSPATDIAVGDGFTLACSADGSAYVWGELAESEEWKPKPVSFLGNPSNIKIVAVAAGDRHALVLTDSGIVYVWGSNDNRELGIEEIVLKKAPIKLSLTNIVSIKGFKNSSFAINDKGDVYAWGSNVWGHLGLGHINPVMQPTLVAALSEGPSQGKVVDVTSGFNHTLFVVAPRDSDSPFFPPTYALAPPVQPYPPTAPSSEALDSPKGQMWTTGSITATGNEPSEEVMVWRKAPQWDGKVVVSGATSNRVGWTVLNDGFLFAWGNGNLGTGEDSQNTSVPIRLWDLDGHKISVVYAGPTGDWAMALTDQGKVYAWGDGTDFRTGLGATSRSLFPRNVEFPSPVKRIALGFSHGLAVTQDYGVFTWGNGKGLGTGGRSNVERSPKRMTGSENLGVCELSAGRNFSMLLTLDGEVYSWGEGTDGRLGHGDDAEQPSPTLIQAFEGMKVVKIASGLLYSLALTDDGSVYSWGYGADGCLGLGPDDLENKSTPTKIPFFENAGKMADLVAVPTSAFAVSENCGLYAWGAPHLGVGTGRTIATPARVASLQKHNIIGVAPGEWQSLAWAGPKGCAPPTAPGRQAPWGPVPAAGDAPTISVTEDPSGGDVQAPPPDSPASNRGSPNPDRAVKRLTSKLDMKRASVGPAPPDPMKFSLHTKALESVASMHKFFPDEPEIDKLAQLGNIDEVRKFLQDKGWDYTDPVQIEAIKKCCGQVKKDENVIRGWIVYAINKQDFESERVLIISDKAYYKCKYDFKKQSVTHTKRYAAVTLFQVLCGKFKDVSKLSGKLRGDAYDKQCGFQIWYSDPAEWKPPSVVLPFQKIRVPYSIYRPFLGPEATLLQQERVCYEVLLALEAMIHWYRNGSSPIEYLHEFMIEAPKRFDGFPPFPARKVAFIPRAPLTLSSGILSVAHNKWLTPKK